MPKAWILTISFSLKGLLSNGVNSTWDQTVLLAKADPVHKPVKLFQFSSVSAKWDNIYLGNAFIVTSMHRYSRFKWVRFTFQCFWTCNSNASLSSWDFCYSGFIKDLEIDNTYTVLFCFPTFQGTLSQSFVVLSTKLVEMM